MESAQEAATALKFNRTLVQMARTVISGMRTAGITRYNGAHLRLEKDAVDWARILGGLPKVRFCVCSTVQHSAAQLGLCSQGASAPAAKSFAAAGFSTAHAFCNLTTLTHISNVHPFPILSTSPSTPSRLPRRASARPRTCTLRAGCCRMTRVRRCRTCSSSCGHTAKRCR